MPYTLLEPFKPKYTISKKVDEGNDGFQVHTVEWECKPSVRVQIAAGKTVKVGFIQVVKAYSIRGDYTKTIREWKLPSTPMCDCYPATDAPWYEPNDTDPTYDIGYSPVLVGPTNQIVKPFMMDRPSVEYVWQIGAGDEISRLRRKQSFQTWLVVCDRSVVPNTYTPLYCFAYSIDQIVSVSVGKAVGQRCKVEVGQSTQAEYPTIYNTAPFPKIPSQAYVQKCPNSEQIFSDTARAH